MNLLNKFHEDQTVNVASRVFTRLYYSHIRKNAPPLGSHVFQENIIIFELIQDTIETNLLKMPRPWWPYIKVTNLLTKFHKDRVFTRKNAPPPGGHVFQSTGIIFELVQDIIRMNLLTEFHEDWTINVGSRVKNDPPLGSHVFQANINLLTKFHEDWTINVASRELTRQILTPQNTQRMTHDGKRRSQKLTMSTLCSVQDIIGMNLLTKFHEDLTINVVSRVKNAPPLGSHVFQANTNLLTKFHEDWTITVASKELTRQMLTAYDGQRTTDKRRCAQVS
ncbi:hypothetical protein DPMN_042373 [Dreissena polymorpha]|uniref:Uncharacterized protein n=1 Tax=Dreissena polymorpha TaxID=45954 RepID=A0A9D4D0P4_DREPO|nr:hypothetical protein DPMN_042373 [Dreissena polymorpha]